MTFRAAWTLNDGLSSSTTTASGTVPATVQAGDVLAVIAVENTGTNTYTISGGGAGAWTVRSGPDDNSNAQRTYVWTKTAGSDSAGATVTVNSTGGSRFIGAGLAAFGVTESSILIALTSDTTSDTSLNWPSVTIPAGGNAWELYSLITFRASTVPNMTTPPSGASIDAKSATAFGASPQFCAIALHETAQTPAGSGSVSFGTATADIAVTNQLYTIAFQTSGPQLGSGSLAASGSGVLALSGTGTGFASGSMAVSGSGSLSTSGRLAANALLARSGSGALSLSAKTAVNAVLSLAGSGSLALSGRQVIGSMMARTGSGLLVLTSRAIYRHQMWDGVKWTEIAPLTFDGTDFVLVPVKLKAGLRSA